eukprot:gnl/MRDRNA2_/MRDRNA2_61899_c0_seq1.p1 gnl/MRDRNA2_/MRDRNA2_61899_c0~~gnl/MRDRNA2_/MRDRNA2_61899_c0_seq1.p1  ORF type:complete len:234 (+),score=58.78 gnl/MRDRNA2_/MRDRNA2_61899_c0_seq1:124-825(+)
MLVQALFNLAFFRGGISGLQKSAWEEEWARRGEEWLTSGETIVQQLSNGQELYDWTKLLPKMARATAEAARVTADEAAAGEVEEAWTKVGRAWLVAAESMEAATAGEATAERAKTMEGLIAAMGTVATAGGSKSAAARATAVAASATIEGIATVEIFQGSRCRGLIDEWVAGSKLWEMAAGKLGEVEEGFGGMELFAQTRPHAFNFPSVALMGFCVWSGSGVTFAIICLRCFG